MYAISRLPFVCYIKYIVRCVINGRCASYIQGVETAVDLTITLIVVYAYLFTASPARAVTNPRNPGKELLSEYSKTNLLRLQWTPLKSSISH